MTRCVDGRRGLRRCALAHLSARLSARMSWWPRWQAVASPSIALGLIGALGLGAALGLSAGAAWSQGVSAPPGHRVFPATALRGQLVIDAPPIARLNGQPVRLAPGARIRGVQGLSQTPASLVGQPLNVHYTWEPSTGLLMDVWILNAVEQTNAPWPVNPQEARQWRFDPAAQRWSPR